MSTLLPIYPVVYLEKVLMIVNDQCICFHRWWSFRLCISRYSVIRSHRRVDGMSPLLPRCPSELMIGSRIRLQSLLPYLLLEAVDIRHYLFRIRDRSHVIIG
jgi:hypothetical protein